MAITIDLFERVNNFKNVDGFAFFLFFTLK